MIAASDPGKHPKFKSVVIKPENVKYVSIADLVPGMIVSEGVVIDVDLDTGQFAVVMGVIEASEDPIAVYASITNEMLDLLVTAVQQIRRQIRADLN